MKTFLKTFASVLFVLAAILVLAMAAVSGLALSTFLVTIGSSIATSVIAGILWMLIAISESLDRLVRPQTQIPEVQETQNTSGPLFLVSKKRVASHVLVRR